MLLRWMSTRQAEAPRTQEAKVHSGPKESECSNRTMMANVCSSVPLKR
jgi:hypothetical protein